MLTKLYDLLSSWRLSIVLTAAGALYYVFLTVWAARSPAKTVQTIAGMSPFALLYTLLLANTLLCVIKRFHSILLQTQQAPLLLPNSIDWQKSFEELPCIKGKGIETEIGTVWVRHRFSSVGTLFLHLSLFLLALGFSLTSLSRFEGRFVAGEGEEIKVDQSVYSNTTAPVPLTSAPPAFGLKVEDILVQFWENELLFTRFTSDVLIAGKRRTIAINDPAFLSPFTSVRLTSFGFAPHYILMVEGMRMPLEEGAVKLNIFPPGQFDSFESRHFPHRFYLSFYPDYRKTGKRVSSKSMNLKNPRFQVQYYRGKVFLGKTVLKPGDSLRVEEFTISFLGVVPTAEFTVVRDVGFPVIVLSFLTALMGLVLRARGPRGELSAKKLPDGAWQLFGKNVKVIGK